MSCAEIRALCVPYTPALMLGIDTHIDTHIRLELRNLLRATETLICV